MSSVLQYDKIIESIYEAALDPSAIPSALHAYARALDGVGAVVVSLSPDGGAIVSPDLEDAARAYAAGWWQHDFLARRGLERRVRGVATDLDLATRAELERHPFYQDFGRRFGFYWFCAYTVHPSGSPPLAISIRRAAETGAFEASDVAAVASLAPHLARALELAARTSAAGRASASIQDALTAMGQGVFGIGSDARVLFRNEIARTACAADLEVVDGRLSATRAVSRSAVEGLVAATLAVARGTRLEAPRTVVLKRREEGRAPLLLRGVPLAEKQGEVLARIGELPRALVVASEPDARRLLDPRVVQEAFDLSPAEARLAVAIATGATLQEAAVAFGLSEATVRSVSKTIFRKTGAARQAELVLILSAYMVIRN